MPSGDDEHLSMIQSCEDLDDAVAEYLEHRGFSNTLECFRSEVRHRKLVRIRLSKSDELSRDSAGRQSRRSSIDEEAHSQAVEKTRIRATGVALLKAFDHGDMPGFLSAWSAFTPKSLLGGDVSSPLAREIGVAEFLSCVHCAVFPFRAAALEEAAGPREASVACAKSMSLFRRYLDRATLPHDNDHEVIRYYALPHVPDPPSHPAFEALFDDAWSARLRVKIEKVMDKVNHWRYSDPLLIRLLLPQETQGIEVVRRPSDTFITGLDDDVDETSASNSVKREAPHDQHNGSRPLLGIKRHPIAPTHSYSVDGESSLCDSDKGSVESNDARGIDTIAGGVEFTMEDRKKQPRQRLLRSDSDRAILGRVDYNAIKRDLRELAEKVYGHSQDRTVPPDDAVAVAAVQTSLLLQTVLWRFARAPPGKTRRGVLYHLIRNDIFDLRSKESDVGKAGGRGQGETQAVTTLLELLLRLAAPLSSELPSLPGRDGSSAATAGSTTQKKQASAAELCPESDAMAQESHESEYKSPPEREAPKDIDESQRDSSSTNGNSGGWQEFGGDPGRLVAEYTTRVLSALVSMSKARSYILNEGCAGTIQLLTETLRGENHGENEFARRLLTILARLSKRLIAQEATVASGFVEWAGEMLGSHLSQESSSRGASPLFLRLTTDILGNIMGSAPGRVAVVAARSDVVRSIGSLLEHENEQVRLNAMRCLKRLLGAQEGREKALAVGMDAALLDVRSRKAGHGNHVFTQDIELLLNMIGGKVNFDETDGRHKVDGGKEDEDDVEDFDSLSDDEPPHETSVVSYFVQATKAPCGEELLRQRYRISTAEAKEEAIVSSLDGRPPFGGEEEELVCGGYKTSNPGGYLHHHPGVIGEAKADEIAARKPTPEAGTATLIRGEEKVYDSRRPGLPDEMQSRPMIPRTPATSTAIPATNGGGWRQGITSGVAADAKTTP